MSGFPVPNSAARRWLARLQKFEPKTKNVKRVIRYYSNMFRATPAWLDDADKMRIRQIYRTAHARGLTVDHIVPLSSTIVCGLHVPWNLEAVPAGVNQQKSNKWWPGCPFEQPGMDFHPQIELKL